MDLRTYKDFLMVFNTLSETCFKGCVDVINNRKLEPHEIKCVDLCTEKFTRVNHRFMSTFVKYQTIRNQRTLDEANKEAEKLNASTVDTLVESATEGTLDGTGANLKVESISIEQQNVSLNSESNNVVESASVP